MLGMPQELWVICRTPREELVFLRHTLEGYDGLCVTTTLPGHEGRVRLLTTEDRRTELEEVLQGLVGEVALQVEQWGGAGAFTTRHPPGAEEHPTPPPATRSMA